MSVTTTETLREMVLRWRAEAEASGDRRFVYILEGDAQLGREAYRASLVPTPEPVVHGSREDAPQSQLTIEEATTLQTRRSRGGKPRTTIFGHPVTAVLRWMGKQGWTFDHAARAVSSFGADIAGGTIKIQLKAGRKGERGEPAAITPDQEKELKKVSGLA